MQVVHLCDTSGAVGRGAVCMDVGTSIYNCRPLCRGCLVFIASQKLSWVWGMQGKQTADNLTPAGNIGIINWSISTDLHISQSVQQYQRHGNNSRAQWCGMTSRTPPPSLDHPWKLQQNATHGTFPATAAYHCCSQLSDAPPAINSLICQRVSVCRSILARTTVRQSFLAGLLAGWPLTTGRSTEPTLSSTMLTTLP